MRALKIAGAALAATFVIVAVLLVTGIPLGFLTSVITDRIERASGDRVTVAGATSIGIWPQLHVTLNDITFEANKDPDTSHGLNIGTLRADMTLGSLWSGRPEITELAIIRPLLSVPLRRERDAAPKSSPAMPAASSRQSDRDAPIIERVTVTDGTVIFFNRRDQVEDRLTDVNVRTIMDADHQINLSAHAQAGDHPLTFEVKATLPSSWSERQTIPVELKLDVSGLLPAQLTAKAEARLNGSVVMINGIAGAIGDGAFNGWASVELASKPLVKLDLDFQRLDFAVPPSQNGQRRSSQAWSDVAFDLIGLNYIDAQIKLSAAALNLGDAHFAPAAIDGTLANGVVRCGVSNLGTYGGQANGEIGIDASGATPVYTMRGDLTGVRALPLLQGLAGFDWLDGKLQAGIAVRSTGASQRAILSNVAGTVSTSFQDGALRGLNVTQMIRTLTSNPLSGWPTGKEQITDLSHLSASFRIENGQAATSDLNLVGPLVKMTGAGTIDLGQQSLSLRVEPKLVMTHEGQGRAPNEPIGFGVPVIINGPWTGPRIYPDVAGILDDPEAAYSKLKEIGKGLFGAGGPSGDPNGAPPNSPDGRPGETLGETLGNLIQQGLNQGLGRGRNQSAKPGDPPPAPDGAAIKDMLQQFLNR